MILIVLAVLSGLIGALAFYLCSPHQRMLARPIPRGVGLFLSGAGMLAAVTLLAAVASPFTAICVTLLITMLVWTLAPFVTSLDFGGERRSDD